MKKLVILAALVLGSLSAMAQGRFVMANGSSGPNGAVNAPVTDTDGTTKASGAAFSAQAYIATVGSQNYLPVGTPVQFSSTVLGYFLGGSLITATTGDVSVLVRVYQTALGSYTVAAATPGAKIGSFNPVTVTLATGPAGDPVLVGLLPLTLTTVASIPEPSTIALGVVGAAALLLRRRRA